MPHSKARGNDIRGQTLVTGCHTARITDLLPMPAGYFRLVLELLGTTASRRQALLEGTGIAPGAAARIGDEVTAGQQLRQIRNANRIGPAGWGLSVGAHFRSETHGYLGHAAVSAPTVGEGLEVVARFTQVRNPCLEAVGERRGREFRLALGPRCELLEEERLPLVEAYFLSVQAILESLLPREPEGGRVEIVGRPSYADRYRDAFHVPVRFGGAEDAFVIPAEWLDRASPLADPEVYEASLRRLEDLAERLSGGRFVGARVAHLLASGGDAGLPLGTVARRLGLSPRTLIRRLAASELSYRELRDAHRCRRARYLLGSTELSMSEIAGRLGYGDASNLGRACHRWFGRSPATARAALREPERGGLGRPAADLE